MNYDVLENDSILIVPSQIKEKILTEMDKKSRSEERRVGKEC